MMDEKFDFLHHVSILNFDDVVEFIVHLRRDDDILLQSCILSNFDCDFTQLSQSLIFIFEA